MGTYSELSTELLADCSLYLIKASQQYTEKSTLISVYKKPRLRGVKSPSQGHRVSEQKIWELNRLSLQGSHS